MEQVLFIIIVSIMFVIFLISIVKWKYLKTEDKWIAILMGITGVSEMMSEYFRLEFQNNMPVYHVFNPIQFLLFCLYFNDSIPFLKRRGLGILLGVLGFGIAILNNVFIQDIYTFPSVFLLFEAFCIIALCMYSYFRMFHKEDFEPQKHVHFWLTTIFLIFWSFTFVIWGMITIFLSEAEEYMSMVYPLLIVINLLTYSGIALVFINYKKLIPSGE